MRARVLPTALHLLGHPSLLPATLPYPLVGGLPHLPAGAFPSPPWCAFFCRFCTTSSFSPHPIRLFTLLLLSSFLPPFRAFPPFLHLLPLRICHLAASADYIAPIPPPLFSLQHCFTAIPSPIWGLFSLLPLFLCASVLTLLPPYLLSYHCLPYSPPPSLPLPPLPPFLLAVVPPLFSTPLLGFRYPISVAALLPL
ncbi:unnamed protein product [Closterium sp. Naga37s-1]|nr:unnamed protein product [Closterium sp. Naga37s-1]CAI5512808.1 unnamed protein product [Closterium sp. Naga37s-1]CAI5512810.1 unnamed protein product [Closterium sp. Naga37s-1]CAI5530529.1 unnamed protein product [Closterium sp. Naga37s-1]CAI5530531.1 unnamed protein product [Closterium sp. Naga37s-1]